MLEKLRGILREDELLYFLIKRHGTFPSGRLALLTYGIPVDIRNMKDVDIIGERTPIGLKRDIRKHFPFVSQWVDVLPPATHPAYSYILFPENLKRFDPYFRRLKRLLVEKDPRAKLAAELEVRRFVDDILQYGMREEWDKQQRKIFLRMMIHLVALRELKGEIPPEVGRKIREEINRRLYWKYIRFIRTLRRRRGSASRPSSQGGPPR